MKESTKILLTLIALVALVLMVVVVPKTMQKTLPNQNDQKAQQIEKPVDETDATIDEIISNGELDNVETSVDDSEIAISKKDLESANAYLNVYDESEY